MELRETWSIFARRAWIPVGLALLVAVASFVANTRIRPTYEATAMVFVSLLPEPPRGPYYQYNNYYDFLATEYVADDLTEIVKSRAFAEDVRQMLNDSSVDVGMIQRSSRPKKTHRIVSITIEGSDPGLVQRIAAAAGTVMADSASKYFAAIYQNSLKVTVIDVPDKATPTATALRGLLDMGIRTMLAFVVGLGIVFLGEYANTSIRSAAEAQRLLGVPVLGEIPVERRKLERRQPRIAPAEAS